MGKTYMIISFHGGNTVRFQTGDMVIAANPSAAPHGQKSQKFGADLALCASFSPEHHSVDVASHGDKDPFVIDGPGSYEYRGYTVIAQQLGKDFGLPAQATTAYAFVMDDIRVCVLGSIVSRDQLHSDTSEVFADTDVLVLPVDGEMMQDVSNLINFIDPKIVIPVGFWSCSDAAIAQFLSEHGMKGQTGEDKITIKKRDIDSLSKSIKLLAL
jgi:hypothetical protein